MASLPPFSTVAPDRQPASYSGENEGVPLWPTKRRILPTAARLSTRSAPASSPLARHPPGAPIECPLAILLNGLPRLSRPRTNLPTICVFFSIGFRLRNRDVRTKPRVVRFCSARMEFFFLLTAQERLTIPIFFIIFYILGYADWPLIAFGFFDMALGLWTWIALKIDKKKNKST